MIILNLINNSLIATFPNLGNSIIGQQYKTRKEALEAYLTLAGELDDEGKLSEKSGIIN